MQYWKQIVFSYFKINGRVTDLILWVGALSDLQQRLLVVDPVLGNNAQLTRNVSQLKQRKRTRRTDM